MCLLLLISGHSYRSCKDQRAGSNSGSIWAPRHIWKSGANCWGERRQVFGFPDTMTKSFKLWRAVNSNSSSLILFLDSLIRQDFKLRNVGNCQFFDIDSIVLNSKKMRNFEWPKNRALKKGFPGWLRNSTVLIWLRLNFWHWRAWLHLSCQVSSEGNLT